MDHGLGRSDGFSQIRSAHIRLIRPVGGPLNLYHQHTFRTRLNLDHKASAFVLCRLLFTPSIVVGLERTEDAGRFENRNLIV
jgi:hypothetical protein